MAYNYSKLERETIIIFNEEDGTADVYTHSRKLINQLNKIALNSSVITVERQTDDWSEYTLPKSWVKIRTPRQLSEENRQKLADRARDNFKKKKENEN